MEHLGFTGSCSRSLKHKPISDGLGAQVSTSSPSTDRTVIISESQKMSLIYETLDWTPRRLSGKNAGNYGIQ